MNTITSSNSRSNFTDISYTEKYTKYSDQYENLRSKIINAFNKIELLSVIEGTRNAHLNFFSPQQLELERERVRHYGLEIITLNKEAGRKGGYGNHSLPYDGGDDFVWRSIITRPQNIDLWKSIWETRSKNVPLGERMIGMALGYPECCSRFFEEVWIQNSWIDTTWQQAACSYANTSNYAEACNSVGDCDLIEFSEDSPIWASNLLRWAGLKIVTHLPCSFYCAETKRIALENLGLATLYGFGNEYNKLCQMLNWDITWTAQHGVATIETPVFTISTVTDITLEKYAVHKKGHFNNIL